MLWKRDGLLSKRLHLSSNRENGFMAENSASTEVVGYGKFEKLCRWFGGLRGRLRDWWKEQVEPRPILIILLDQFSSILVQALFWSVLAGVVIFLTPGRLSPATKLFDGVSDFLGEVYKASNLFRDLSLSLLVGLAFLLISFVPVVRRIQEDGCRILYLFGTLTCVLCGAFKIAHVQFGRGYGALFIGVMLCGFGVFLAVCTELLLRWRKTKNVRARIFYIIRTNKIASLLVLLATFVLFLLWR